MCSQIRSRKSKTSPFAFTHPDYSIEAFLWSEKEYSAKEILDRFGQYLPFMILVTQGYTGRDEWIHLVPNDEMYWLRGVATQSRIVIRDDQSRYYSVPYNCKSKVCPAVSGGKFGKPVSIEDVYKKSLSDYFTFEHHRQWVHEGGDHGKNYDIKGLLEIVDTYEERFLLVHTPKQAGVNDPNDKVEGPVYHAPLVIPVYLPVAISVGLGMVKVHERIFQRSMLEIKRYTDTCTDNIDHILKEISEIMLFEDEPGGDYEEVHYRQFQPPSDIPDLDVYNTIPTDYFVSECKLFKPSTPAERQEPIAHNISPTDVLIPLKAVMDSNQTPTPPVPKQQESREVVPNKPSDSRTGECFMEMYEELDAPSVPHRDRPPNYKPKEPEQEPEPEEDRPTLPPRRGFRKNAPPLPTATFEGEEEIQPPEFIPGFSYENYEFKKEAKAVQKDVSRSQKENTSSAKKPVPPIPKPRPVDPVQDDFKFTPKDSYGEIITDTPPRYVPSPGISTPNWFKSSPPTAPKSNPTTPKSNPTAPKSNPTNPKANPTTPKANPTAPKSNPTAPKSNPTAPKSNPTAPKANPTAPKSKPAAPQETNSAAQRRISIYHDNGERPDQLEQVELVGDVGSDISILSVSDVARCLGLLKLSKHEEAFRFNQIDGPLLLELTEEVLTVELNFGKFDATKLMKFVRGWRPNLN